MRRQAHKLSSEVRLPCGILKQTKSWKETEKSIGMNPKYTIKFYCDTTNQDEEKDIKEITLYENGEYATIFITSPGGVKQNYKTSIDISELVI